MRRLLVALALSLALIAPASVALAQHPTDSAGPSSGHNKTQKAKQLKPSCVKKMKKKHHPRLAKKCRGKITNHASKKKRVHRKDLSSAQLKIVGTNGETLGHALKGGAVWYRTFSQDGITVILAKQLYGEKHEAGGFFDGTNVWLNSPASGGPDGFHSCFPTSEIGYDVTISTCDEHYQDPGGMTPYYQYWMRWNVAFGWGAINPIKFTYNVHMNLHGSGRVTYWVGDTKTGDNPV